MKALPPNAFGLYGMGGNVSEWVSDWYDPRYYSQLIAVNPAGPVGGSMKCLRGGAWHSTAEEMRVSARFAREPRKRMAGDGFRCARDVEP